MQREPDRKWLSPCLAGRRLIRKHVDIKLCGTPREGLERAGRDSFHADR